MSEFCQDRELLCIEPVIFIGGGFASQQLIGGTGASIAASQLHWSGGDFLAAGVKPGMIATVWQSSAAEGNAYEIVSVDSQSQLTISVLRADPTGPILPPLAIANTSFHIRTYQPQIQAVSAALAEKLRRITESTAVQSGQFADSAQLRTTTAYGTLQSIFVARAENASSADANWIKAQYYRDLFRQHQVQLRLAVDADGDGIAELTRTLGHVQFRRS
jgi:hypothetical protein